MRHAPCCLCSGTPVAGAYFYHGPWSVSGLGCSQGPPKVLPRSSNHGGSNLAHCAMAAYEAAMATVRRQPAPFSATGFVGRPDASPALHEAGRDELRLHARRRLDLAGRDGHIRLDVASEKLLSYMESRRKRPINPAKFTEFDTGRAPRRSMCLSRTASWPHSNRVLVIFRPR
ncbi:hypothetical protein V8C37DRAFT_399327 [Trichoderma ceciliae]